MREHLTEGRGAVEKNGLLRPLLMVICIQVLCVARCPGVED